MPWMYVFQTAQHTNENHYQFSTVPLGSVTPTTWHSNGKGTWLIQCNVHTDISQQTKSRRKLKSNRVPR